jgi:predicted TIM-barrel fold metal-dependent hydrolase
LKQQLFCLSGPTGMPSETATAVMSLLMGGILERFPKLKICFAHGGGSFPYTIGRMQHGYLTRPDLCAQVIFQHHQHQQERLHKQAEQSKFNLLQMVSSSQMFYCSCFTI